MMMILLLLRLAPGVAVGWRRKKGLLEMKASHNYSLQHMKMLALSARTPLLTRQEEEEIDQDASRPLPAMDEK
jgi:hypothetical protein